jgi:hypothetical protein
LRWPFGRGNVEALVIEMRVHTVEPRRYRAASRFEKKPMRSLGNARTRRPQTTLIAASVIISLVCDDQAFPCFISLSN